MHWINVDGFPDLNVNFLLDFGRPLPFPDDTFDGIFCEHVLEHFSFEDGGRLAQEACRVLRTGGCLRLIVPDAKLLLERYFGSPSELVERRAAGMGTPMEVVNSYFRQRYEHQFLYDWESMEKLLSQSGFKQIKQSVFGSGSFCAPIALDDKKYEWESLYVEAQK